MALLWPTCQDPGSWGILDPGTWLPDPGSRIRIQDAVSRIRIQDPIRTPLETTTKPSQRHWNEKLTITMPLEPEVSHYNAIRSRNS